MIEKIRANLGRELLGIRAWAKMAVKSSDGENVESESLQLFSDWLSKDRLSSLKEAAVLIALFEKNGETWFPLIRRPENEKNHPGQIALPGGAKEENENLEETALREAYEEIGIVPEDVQIIGKLTPLPVPVSGYLIHPYVGIINKEPEWKINNEEVAEFFVLKLSELLESNNGYSEKWTLRGFEVDVPIFKVMNQTVWGATASVLSEFIELTK